MGKQAKAITNDIVFKKIFGKVGNENITKDFLEHILDIKINSLTLDVNKILQGEKIESKTTIVDVKAELEDKTKLFIEMQRAKSPYMINRVLTYWSRIFDEKLKKGDGYTNENILKTIAILITEYSLEETEEFEKYHTVYKIIEKDERKIILTDKLEIHIIELNKFKESENIEKDNWIKFIKAKGVEDMEKIKTKNLTLEEAQAEYRKLVGYDEEKESTIDREMELLDIITMYKWHEEIGEERGQESKEKEIILNMYEEGVEIKDICRFTNIKEKEVKEIIKEYEETKLNKVCEPETKYED